MLKMTNAGKFSFQPATIDDIERIKAWYNQINGPEFLSHCIPSALLDEKKSFKGVLRWCIINYDDREIGTIWLEQKDQKINELDLGIFLNHEKLMGKGLGKSIIKNFLGSQSDLLRQYKICLNVRMNNQRAIECYRGSGFDVIDKRRKESCGEIIDYFRMQLLMPDGG
jgi:hypothetical protein